MEKGISYTTPRGGSCRPRTPGAGLGCSWGSWGAPGLFSSPVWCFWLLLLGLVFSCASSFVTLLPYVSYLDGRCLQVFALCAKSAPMPCVPQKLMFSHVFLSFLYVVLAAECLGEEGTRSKQQGQNNAPKRVTNNKIDQFSNLSNVTSKITWQNGLPEPL